VPLHPNILAGADVVVDALFGAGLARPIEGQLAHLVDGVNASGLAVIAVDVPSGVDGTTGEVRGTAIRAAATVTFFRLKPGHVLLPGRSLCGEVSVADIGIPDSVLAEIAPKTFVNEPALWLADYPWPKDESHKYARGHAVVVSGPLYSTGAARLAARGSLRAGAGLVTVASPRDALQVNAANHRHMVREADDARALAMLADRRKNAVLIGPAWASERTRKWCWRPWAGARSCSTPTRLLARRPSAPAVRRHAGAAPKITPPTASWRGCSVT
jgi:NAD(P)H-hydrate epimerase